MNIEIANRLVKLRKEKGLSQEELAEKLGLSRQAVSKWERAESSPDTDNLICLARLYGISLDELLKTADDEKTIVDEQVKNEEEQQPENKSSTDEKNEDVRKEKVHISFDGIHVIDKDGEVHIDKHGIRVKDLENDVHIDSTGIKEKLNCKHENNIVEGAVTGAYIFLALIAYILIGFFVPGGWSFGWILFILIPVVSTTFGAIRRRSFTVFCFPCLIAAIYLFLCMALPTLGVIEALWHPLWVLFLTIPLYYIVFGPIDKAMKLKRLKKSAIIDITNAVDNEEEDE